jgi:NAD(P)-dependent dehydrogenase (short-subunit alcohol dehydrogenase family)
MNIIVIGADRGLGKILTERLLAGGHTVFAGLLYPNQAEWAVQNSDRLHLFRADVADEKTLNQAAQNLEACQGKVDAIVDVAGILPACDRTSTLLEEPAAAILDQFRVNALGVLLVFRTFYSLLRKGGKFLAITSEGGSFTCAGSLFPAYGISKTAANKVVQTLRFTVRDVEILAVHPGRMNTEMGRTTCQIEPEESAEGICRILEGKTLVDGTKAWFIDYQGKPMPL